MIITTTGKIVKSIFNNKIPTGFPENLIQEANDKLHIIHFASSISDLRYPPGNYLKKLSGVREGQFSIRVNDKWRICFSFDGKNAFNVEIIDYH